MALLGAGRMGTYHARAIAERDDLVLAAVCDPDTARAEAVAEECGGRVVASLEELGEVDAAVIAAATSVHEALATDLLGRGVAVLVEKPLAGSTAEARAIAEAAAASGAVCQVGHILRFDPVSRALGRPPERPVYIDVSWVAPFSPRSLDTGVVMDLVIHGLDVVLDWMGDAPERVDAFGAGLVGAHEDLVSVRLAFAGPAVATLRASRLSRTRERVVRLFTPRAYWKLDYGARTAECVRAKGRTGTLGPCEGVPADLAMEDLVEVEPLVVPAEPDALRAQLDAFVKAVRGQGPVVCSAEDGVRSVTVADQVVGALGGASCR